MTNGIRKALQAMLDAKDVSLLSHHQELFEEELRKWHESLLVAAVRKCIRIASECQGRDISPADAITAEFENVL
jgi:hypothetical protein